MIKAIFFDLDDTLYAYTDSNAKIQSEFEAISYFCKKYPKYRMLEAYALFQKAKQGVKKRFAEYPAQNNRELWFIEFMRQEKGFDKAMLHEMEKIYWQCVFKKIEPYYDAAIILPYLAEKYALGIITNGLKAIQQKKVKTLRYTQYFDAITTSSEAGFDKPHREVFQLALQRAKVKPKEAVMVGDSPYMDIFPANKIGMTTIWLRRGQKYYYPTEGRMKPTHTVTNLVELRRWF